MNSEIKIRFARQGDAELLANLGKETFNQAFASHPLMPKADLELYLKDAFSVSLITSELKEPLFAFLLAEINKQAVGYAKLIAGEWNQEFVAQNPVKLKRLYVRKEFVGSGIGASLITRCQEEARKSRHDAIWLTVWEDNQRAQDFYRKWNFKPCGKIDFYFGNTILTDITMQRFL